MSALPMTGNPFPAGPAPARPQGAIPTKPATPPAFKSAAPVRPAPAMVGGQVDPAPGAPAPGPASTPAPNAPAPAGPAAPGPQQAAAPIATPPTATSQPLADSPWAYEKMWGALGNLGDPELDAMVKSQTMGQLGENPYGAPALEAANAATFEKGMSGMEGQKQAMAADLARRGITGPAAAAMMAEAETATRAEIASGQRSNEQEMRDKGVAQKQQAVQQAQSLASDLAKRGVDIESLRMNRESLAQQLQAARAGGGRGEDMIELVNPDGSVSQVPMNMLEFMLDMDEGGMF